MTRISGRSSKPNSSWLPQTPQKRRNAKSDDRQVTGAAPSHVTASAGNAAKVAATAPLARRQVPQWQWLTRSGAPSIR